MERTRSTGRTVVRRVMLLTVPLVTAIGWSARPAVLGELLGDIGAEPLALATIALGLTLLIQSLFRRHARQAEPDQPNETHAAVAPAATPPTAPPVTTAVDVGFETPTGPPYTVHFNHEARTPMTAILGYAEMLAAPEATPSERVDFLEAVRRNCQSLLRLADETLAFARLDLDDLVVRHDTVTVPELLEEPLLMVRPEAAAQQLSITTTATGRMPEAVETDAFHTRQILTHLLRAAISVSETGPIQIALRYRPDGSPTPAGLDIDVHDSNPRLTPALRSALFDPWHNSTLEYVDVLGGAGLRLAIARRLTEHLGGTLEPGPCTSTGGSFRLSLPCTAPADAAWIDGSSIFVKAKEQPRTDQTYPLQGRVLVVESTSELAWLVRAMVARRGVEVEVCTAAADAWDRVVAETTLERPWDAVVVDVDDPNVDGPLLVQRFLLDELSTPLVAVGAAGIVADGQPGVTMLSKPARGLDLYGAIRPYLHAAA